MSIGRKLSADELGLVDQPLPFTDLDSNFSDKDALLEAIWPEVDAIVGNPPYLSSKLMKVKYDVDYVDNVRKAFKEVPGRADYCVYWFKKSHDHLKEGQRAGLVGTNTIRQNYSRIGGLDYIIGNGGYAKAVKWAASGCRFDVNNITRDNWDELFDIKDSIIYNCTPLDIKGLIDTSNDFIDCRVTTQTGIDLATLQASQQFKLYTGLEFPL